MFGELKRAGSYTLSFVWPQKHLPETLAVWSCKGTAHSHIFLCGHRDAVIRLQILLCYFGEKGVVKCFSFENTYSYPWEVLDADRCQNRWVTQAKDPRHTQKHNNNGQLLIFWKQTGISEDIRKAAFRFISWIFPFPRAPFFSLWLHFSCEPFFLFSHMNVWWTQPAHTIYSRLVYGKHFPVSLYFSITTQWPLVCVVYLLSWIHKDGTHFVASWHKTPLEQKTHHVITWKDPLMHPVAVFLHGDLTHCLVPLPLRQNTKALCENVTPCLEVRTSAGCQIQKRFETSNICSVSWKASKLMNVLA